MSLTMATATASRAITGVVVTSGKMMKTVKVRIPGQKWNKRIHKYFNAPSHILVHDPNSSLLAGDIITLRSGDRVSKHVHHVLSSIVSPFSTPLAARPPVFTDDQRLALRDREREAKLERRYAREKDSTWDRELAGKRKALAAREEELERIAQRREWELCQWAAGAAEREEVLQGGKRSEDNVLGVGPLVVQTMRRARGRRVRLLLEMRKLEYFGDGEDGSTRRAELHRLTGVEMERVRVLRGAQNRLEELHLTPVDRRPHVEALAGKLHEWREAASQEYSSVESLLRRAGVAQDDELHHDFMRWFAPPQRPTLAPASVTKPPLEGESGAKRTSAPASAVLPGGVQHKGRIQDRARENKNKALRSDRKAAENREELKRAEESRRDAGAVGKISSDSLRRE